MFGISDTNAELARFWSQMEEKIGERILVYALGQYVGGRDIPGPLWGLIYVSETAVHFQHFPQKNWFSAILNMSGRTGPAAAPDRDEEVVYRIGLRDVKALRKPGTRGFLHHLVFAREPVFALESTFEGIEPFQFTIENRRSQFVTALEKQLQAQSED